MSSAKHQRNQNSGTHHHLKMFLNFCISGNSWGLGFLAPGIVSAETEVMFVESLEHFRCVGSPCPESSFLSGCQSLHPRTGQRSLAFPFVPAVSAAFPRMWPAVLQWTLILSRFLPLLFFSSHRLPVVACLGLETLEEGEVSSVALAGNPARMQPTKTHSAQPAGASDLQPPQVSRERAFPAP